MTTATKSPPKGNGFSQPLSTVEAPAAQSTALTLTVPGDQLARIEAIAAECSLEALANYGHFTRAMKMALGIRLLKETISGPILKELMSLQGSALGFRTDKDRDGGYDEKTVKECAIAATLRGANWVGNEFNIIASREYMTKEFFTRKLREFPGLTDLKLFPGVPHSANGGAMVPYSATWKLNGRPDRIDRLLTRAEGGDIDERICVRVNQGMGADAILGKAERKIRAAIYSRVTGSDVTDADVDDAERPSRRPVTTLDDLAKTLEGKPAGPTAGITADPTAGITADPEALPGAFADQLDAALDAAETVEQIDQIEAELLGRGLSAAVAAEVGTACGRAKERLAKS